MLSPYPEFVLTYIICIEKALKGTEIVFVLTGISYHPCSYFNLRREVKTEFD